MSEITSHYHWIPLTDLAIECTSPGLHLHRHWVKDNVTHFVDQFSSQELRFSPPGLTPWLPAFEIDPSSEIKNLLKALCCLYVSIHWLYMALHYLAQISLCLLC